MIVLNPDNNEGYLSIDLTDILTQIENITNYKWKLLWIDGTSHTGGANMLELEKNVNDSKDGLPILGSQLLPFSELFSQLYELILIGDKDEEQLVKLEDEEQMKENCEFFIELVDSSYWEITSKNKDFNENIKMNLS